MQPLYLHSAENAPDGKIVKPDVCIAKNYLKEVELEDMGRLVNAVLDMAERMAKRHIPMTMEDWAKRIDIILEAAGDALLNDAGTVKTWGWPWKSCLCEWDNISLSERRNAD